MTRTDKLVIGVTGGIGSGKTAATNMFKSLGIDVVDADVISRQMVLPGSSALAAIVDQFGPGILLTDGSLDRGGLRARIFSDSAEKRWLEALLHPLIRDETVRQLQAGRSPYVILASPLLLETDQHDLTDRVLLIDVPETLQIARTSARDKTTPEAVKAIISSQMLRAERLMRADDVIVNDQDFGHLQREVQRMHEYYSAMAAASSKQPNQRP